MIQDRYTHVREDGTTVHRYLPPNREVSDWISGFFPEGYRGWCVDVGASDGISDNNTYLLERDRHWNVLSVEANPYFKDSLGRIRGKIESCGVGAEYKNDVEFHVHLDNPEAFSSLSPEPHERFKELIGTRWATPRIDVHTLDFLLLKHDFPKLDALSIDTEGTERDVLSGIDLTAWTPRIILAETWDQGSLDDVLEPFGYKRIWRYLYNDGYLKEVA